MKIVRKHVEEGNRPLNAEIISKKESVKFTPINTI